MDPCQTRFIAADRFFLLVRSLGMEIQLLRHAMSRIREGEAWRAEIAALPAGPRLVRTLLRLAAPGPTMPVDVGLDQTEVGQAAGLSRSTERRDPTTAKIMIGVVRRWALTEPARRQIKEDIVIPLMRPSLRLLMILHVQVRTLFEAERRRP